MCGNAIVLSPSPSGAQVCEQLISHIHAEFDAIGADRDLVQMVPAPASKVKTQHLMENVDLLVVTGSQDNVRRAYASGTPAIGVGAGNVSVIIDESANLDAAAAKVAASKTFDNSTSCSSENALIVLDSVFDDFMAALHRVGGRLLQGAQADTLRTALFQPNGLNRHLIARDIGVLQAGVGMSETPDPDAAFFLIEGRGVGADFRNRVRSCRWSQRSTAQRILQLPKSRPRPCSTTWVRGTRLACTPKTTHRHSNSHANCPPAA